MIIHIDPDLWPDVSMGKKFRPWQKDGTVALIVSMMSESLNYRTVLLYLDSYRTLAPTIQRQSQITQFLRDSLHYQVLW